MDEHKVPTTALELLQHVLQHIQRGHSVVNREHYIECSCGTTFWHPSAAEVKEPEQWTQDALDAVKWRAHERMVRLGLKRCENVSPPETPQEDDVEDRDVLPGVRDEVRIEPVARNDWRIDHRGDLVRCAKLLRKVSTLDEAVTILGNIVRAAKQQPPSLLAAPPVDRVTTFTPMLWMSMTEEQKYAEYIRVRQLLAAPEGRVREVVGRILWSKVTEIGGGKCYLTTNLDEIADELEAALGYAR